MHDQLARVASSFSRWTPRLSEECSSAGVVPAAPRLSSCASVALVVRPGTAELELLLIKRATAVADPWSGHMALPGGRRSHADRDGLATAIRETKEEVGIDLDRIGRLLGRLDDVEPRTDAPRVNVSPFVFAVAPGTEVHLNQEVALAIWVSIGHLSDPSSVTEHQHPIANGAPLRFPAIGYLDHVIWGITHRIIGQFLDVIRDNE